MKNKGYANFFLVVGWGIKVYYGRCANGECWVLGNFKKALSAAILRRGGVWQE